MRRLKRVEPDAVTLFEAETTPRWFPPPRGIWASRGEQAEVPVAGQDAKRVPSGAIGFRAGHRVIPRRPKTRQADFQEFLRLLRRRHGGRPLHLLLDQAPCHDTKGSRAPAARLGIEPVRLPKRCSGLNAMGHLWKPVRGRISANWQWSTGDEHADPAERRALGLSDRQALRKAGSLSDDFWLRHL